MQSNEIKISYFEHPFYKDYASDKNGNIYSLKFGKIKLLNPSENNFGYLQFKIYNNRNHKFYQVHRFVFECLNNELIENGYEIDHLDRNKKNNQITNLRIVSKSTNNLNRFSNEEVERSYEVELPEDAIKIIRYNSHLFENLFFSPSTNCLYKTSERYKFKIPFKKYQIKVNGKIYFNYKTQINDINKKCVHICLNKLRKDLNY